MSTPHLGAEKGDIAESVLLPGDPLRAKYIAENFLKNPICYNNVRGMLGFTGSYKGKRISVQGTGMGIPSISIYIHELMAFYGVKTLIRIGTCGAMQEEIKVRDVVFAMSACTDSSMNKMRFNGCDYAPTANFDLLNKAWQQAQKMGVSAKVGSVMTSDAFYRDNPDSWKLWAQYGVIAAEMETAALYTLASKFNTKALALLTVSDSAFSKEDCSAEERQTSFHQMMEIALEIA
ncbi:MAG: purine-nucleoside phosphorylase [Spirochaetales bacterium]|nr:purine-nucleoside phosphorylase [Spirochaetales bacterium]